jgi:hypothetical protein
MNLLTDDMSDSVDNSAASAADKELIRSILYQERQNKERTWDKDAEQYITKLIDDSARGSTE